MMDLLESINAGVVNRERNVKAGMLKEGWTEANGIMAGVRSSCWSAAGGPVFPLAWLVSEKDD